MKKIRNSHDKTKIICQVWALTLLVATYFTGIIIEQGSLFNKVHASELNQKLMMDTKTGFYPPETALRKANVERLRLF